MIVRYTRIAAAGCLAPAWSKRIWPRRTADAGRVGVWESEGGALRPERAESPIAASAGSVPTA